MALTAMYYPYSRSLRKSTLRKAALLFDTLYFLDSEPWFIRAAITRDKIVDSSMSAEADQIEQDYNLLASEGFIQIADATNISRDYNELLTVNVINDISEDEFCRLAIAHSADTWSILRDRIPPMLLETLYPGAGTFSEAISLQAIINASGDLSRITNENVRKFAEFRWSGKNLDPESAIRLFLERRGYRYVIGGNPHIELPAYTFPFMHASSLRVNECLVTAALYGCVPYSDSLVHDSMLRLKVGRSLSAIDTQPELKRALSIDMPLRFPKQSFALEILDRFIPDDALNLVDMDELLAYRLRNERLLSRFHSYLEMLSGEIEDVTPGDEYEKRISRTVSSKVLPELVKARDDLMASYEDAFTGIVAPSSAAIFSSVSATVFSGLDLWHVLLAGALAEGAVLVAKAPAEILKAWKGKRASNRSPLAYIAGIDRLS